MKKLVFYGIVIVMFVFSCTSEGIKESTFIEFEKENSRSFDLPEEEIISIVELFQRSVAPHTLTRNKRMNLSVKNKYLLNTDFNKTRTAYDGINPLIYEVEMNDGFNKGKAIVSGDRRFPEVLAYIPSYNDSLYETSLEPLIMIQMAKSTLLTKIQNYEAESATRSFADSIRGEISVQVYPFCTTEWGEGTPYNNLLPEAWVEVYPGFNGRPGNSIRMKYYTGKSVAAIVQIMAFFEYYFNIDGTIIDWKALKTDRIISENNRNMVAKLYKSIYDSTGTHPIWGQSYNDVWPIPGLVTAVISMETPIDNVLDFLYSKRISTSSYQKWDIEIVKKSIINMRPVFVGDAINAFIVDGYAISEIKNSMDNVYLHCNFCRYGSFDGYYLVNEDGSIVFSLNGLDYQDIFLNIIPNIVEKHR